MYLLDTNHCSYLIEGNPRVAAELSAKGSAPVATASIVHGELLYMAYRSERQTENLVRVSTFLQNLRVYHIDEAVADAYGALKAAVMLRFGPKDKSKRRQTQISQIGFSDNDLWIAAVAIRHNLVLVSADTDFVRLQQVRPLQLENWLGP